MPADTPDYMADAWVSCLHWAIAEPEVVARFRAETGNTYAPPKSGLERMIDEASGADKAFAEEFVEWFNENVWGPM
jgi:hypothetical protein